MVISQVRSLTKYSKKEEELTGCVRGGIKVKLEFCNIYKQLTRRGLTPKQGI